MALKTRKRSSLWQLVHFLLRFVGVNGMFALAVGAVVWFVFNQQLAGVIVMIAGASAVALALLAEVPTLAGAVASHRGAAGFNVLVQVLLAAALVVGGNVYSFYHSKRFDLTHDQSFTLDEKLKARLASLRGDTDIIVYMPHVSFGQRVDLRQDDYDQAAEKIIAKKVEDLVEQFSDAGPRFRVTKYDTQSKTKKDRRRKINVLSGELSDEQLKANDNPTKEHPAKDSELLKTIEKAPENSIFFYARETKHLQRLSFNDIYHVDKKASEELTDKNLVLVDQGVQTFAEKVFKIEEKSPRIAIAIVHGWLGQDATADFGMPGFKTFLASRGLAARDIVLWNDLLTQNPTPTALDYEENRYQILEGKIDKYKRLQEVLKDETKEYEEAKSLLQEKRIDEFNKKFIFMYFESERGFRAKTRAWVEAYATGLIQILPPLTLKTRERGLAHCDEGIDYNGKEIATLRNRLEQASTELAGLPRDRLMEQRRTKDVKEKFKMLLADVDLLIVPRLTLINLMIKSGIRSELHAVETAHIDAIKDFMKAGKPVLFCTGPPLMRRGGKDSLEKLLEEFNIKLASQTIVFTSEGDSLEDRDEKNEMGGAVVEIPPVVFEWKTGLQRFAFQRDKAPPAIRTSMRLTTRGLDEKSRGLKIRYPRPVYVETWSPDTIAAALGALANPWPGGPSQALIGFRQTKYDESAVFLMSDADCWNEDQPFGATQRGLQFERPKPDDPNNGTLHEKRKGPFPIGVALQTDLPADWYENDSSSKRPKIRLAVIGDGALFVGDHLAPMREKLFLDVSNWLLGRDNLLARDSATWSYPRVELGNTEKVIWEWSARLGLPLAFVYLGFVVGLVRRMR